MNSRLRQGTKRASLSLVPKENYAVYVIWLSWQASGIMAFGRVSVFALHGGTIVRVT